jgi:hypothetical protein
VSAGVAGRCYSVGYSAPPPASSDGFCQGWAQPIAQRREAPLRGSGRHQLFLGGGLGSALLPKPRRCQDLDLCSGSNRGLALVALALVATGRSRVRQLARSLRRVPRAGLSGGADLAAGRPRRSAAAREAAGLAQAAPGDCLPLTTGALALGWPHVCPTARRSYWHPSARLPPRRPHRATAGAAVGRDLETVEKVVTGWCQTDNAKRPAKPT